MALEARTKTSGDVSRRLIGTIGENRHSLLLFSIFSFSFFLSFRFDFFFLSCVYAWNVSNETFRRLKLRGIETRDPIGGETVDKKQRCTDSTSPIAFDHFAPRNARNSRVRSRPCQITSVPSSSFFFSFFILFFIPFLRPPSSTTLSSVRGKFSVTFLSPSRHVAFHQLGQSNFGKYRVMFN